MILNFGLVRKVGQVKFHLRSTNHGEKRKLIIFSNSSYLFLCVDLERELTLKNLEFFFSTGLCRCWNRQKTFLGIELIIILYLQICMQKIYVLFLFIPHIVATNLKENNLLWTIQLLQWMKTDNNYEKLICSENGET